MGRRTTDSFEEIKCRLVKLPMLHLPDNKGRFNLYSDASKFATGSALYKIQNGKPKLIAYASKSLPKAVRNYSITELEVCGLAINISSFAHLLKRVDFDAIVDHLTLMHIVKGNAGLTTNYDKKVVRNIKFLLHLTYTLQKEKMILIYFLSRQKHDDSNPHEIIHISFNMQGILQTRYYNLGEENLKNI